MNVNDLQKGLSQLGRRDRDRPRVRPGALPGVTPAYPKAAAYSAYPVYGSPQLKMIIEPWARLRVAAACRPSQTCRSRAKGLAS